MKITIVGTGYIGLSNAMLLAQHNGAVAIGIVPAKVGMLTRRILLLEDAEIEGHLGNKPLNFKGYAEQAKRLLGRRLSLHAPAGRRLPAAPTQHQKRPQMPERLAATRPTGTRLAKNHVRFYQ